MAHSHDHHHHDHSHSHTPMTYNRAFAISVFFNFAFTVIEAVYAILAHSMSLLADAGHNLGDVLGLVMAWGASWLMGKSASLRYSYGYKKTSILAALANALLLVFTSAIIAYESVHKLIHPVAINEKTIIIVALLGILINGGTALLFMRGRGSDLNIQGAFLHLAYDALISVGVVMAGIVILYTHWLWLDPLVGLLIVGAILLGTWELLVNSVNMILDAVPHNVEPEAVKTFLQNLKGVQAVHDLHIWGLSTKETALTAHLVMPEQGPSDSDYVEINHELLERFTIHHVTLQVEKGHAEDPCGQASTC